jgi:hypothetical protein
LKSLPQHRDIAIEIFFTVGVREVLQLVFGYFEVAEDLVYDFLDLGLTLILDFLELIC